MNMKTIDPYLLFNGNCRQAMEFYAECLGADLFKMTYGEGPGEQPDAIKDKIMHSKITKGELVIMASDPHDATPVTQGNSYFLHLNCDSAEEIERLFSAIGKNGKLLLPLQDMFWGARFGMVTDQFGVNWMFSFELPKQN
jgi:PhnB protein